MADRSPNIYLDTPLPALSAKTERPNIVLMRTNATPTVAGALFLLSGRLRRVAAHTQAIGDAGRAAAPGPSKPYPSPWRGVFAMPAEERS